MESGHQVLILESDNSDIFLRSLMESGKPVQVKQNSNGLISVHDVDDFILNRSCIILQEYPCNSTHRILTRYCPSKIEHFNKTLSKISQTNGEVCS